MDVQIYNTMTRRKETFRPIEPGKVGMYHCGPTVYDRAHIGNMRTYIMADLIRRTFEYLDYEVKQVMNITDVGHLTSDADEGKDRMLVGARRTGRDPWEIAGHFTRLFFEDAADLNILRPHVVRYHCLTASYRVTLTFSWAGLESASDSLRRLRENVRRLREDVRRLKDETDGLSTASPQTVVADRFRAAIADDFNAPSALAVAWKVIHQANRAVDGAEKRMLLELALDLDRVLGLRLTDAVAADESLPADVAALIQQREAARAVRDWPAADALRETIRQRGYEVEDTPSGTQWRRVPG